MCLSGETFCSNHIKAGSKYSQGHLDRKLPIGPLAYGGPPEGTLFQFCQVHTISNIFTCKTLQTSIDPPSLGL